MIIYINSIEDKQAFRVEEGHESVIEHASASFLITTNRAITNEIVRHRIASYSQVSTRYVKYKDNIEFIQPYNITKDTFTEWVWLCEKAEKTYYYLINQGAKPEVARDILPLCLATKLVMTANFREWRHFLKLRLSKKAHPQIQQIARFILTYLNKEAPNVFWDITY